MGSILGSPYFEKLVFKPILHPMTPRLFNMLSIPLRVWVASILLKESGCGLLLPLSRGSPSPSILKQSSGEGVLQIAAPVSNVLATTKKHPVPTTGPLHRAMPTPTPQSPIFLNPEPQTLKPKTPNPQPLSPRPKPLNPKPLSPKPLNPQTPNS